MSNHMLLNSELIIYFFWKTEVDTDLKFQQMSLIIFVEFVVVSEHILMINVFLWAVFVCFCLGLSSWMGVLEVRIYLGSD